MKNKKNLLKIFIIMAIIIAITILGVFFLNKNDIKIVSQRREERFENLDESKYPGYKEKLEAIQKEHPNWNFTIVYTGLNWDDVIVNESEANHSINLVDGSNVGVGTGEWLCPVCGEKVYQAPGWKCTSQKGVAYQMDPRNFLNTENIFQFETLSYVDGMYTLEGIEKILENSFMHNITVKDLYKETIPNNNFSNKKFSEIIMEISKKINVSPYHLVIRLVQGNIAMAGDSNTPMDAVKGNIEGYAGLFNYFNIGSKISGENAREKGLNRAKEENWTTPEKSIEAGANYITENYIQVGQDTIYLEKFDVIDDKKDGLYKHQYMQNVHGASAEGNRAYNIYSNGMLDSKFSFIIPVYENMPNETKRPNLNEKALSLWTDSSKLKTELTSYINAITDKNLKDFIPVEDRIAVFDMDGTLCCETDPGYFDHKLLYYRVMEDPDYKDKASEEEKETAQIIKTYFETGEYPKGLDVKHGKAVATAFKGMTLEEFDNYVKKYRSEQMQGYTNLTNGQAFYKPMLEVVEYLQANDFKVYIVSGTDRLITRGLAQGVINIPLSQMIGSDESLVATNQGEKDGLDYTFTKEDKVITGGEFLVKNLKMNKVNVIEQEIGQKPVLCFGNSSGDEAMANFTISNNKYKSGAYMLCCDDTVRENGNIEKANKMYESCEKNGYTAISMKNDWKTIYGANVTKK